MVATTAACGGGEVSSEPEPRPIAVRVVTASVETLREEAHYVGELGSAVEATVVARLAGTVASLPRAEGERVRRGELVAVLDAPEQSARQRRAAAELARAREESELACEQHATNQRLHAGGALATLQLDQSETRCESSGDAVDAARSGLWELRAVGGKRRERAPVDGRVLAWLVQPGEHVMPGRPIVRIGSDDREVRVRIVEADLRRGVGVGTDARLVMADGRELHAPVTEIAPASRGPAHTVEVTVALGEEAGVGSLPHGSSVDVSFVLAEARDAPVLPVEALQQENGRTVVYVADDGVARARTVRPVVRAGGRVAIEAQLELDELVVVGDAHGLSDGASLYPVSGEAP